MKHAIAHITGNYYYTLADALSNATAGSTVVLTNPTDEIDLTIPLGVTLEISAGLQYNNTNTLINNGTINILGGGIFTNTGIYKGSGVFKGGFINNGTISPGN